MHSANLDEFHRSSGSKLCGLAISKYPRAICWKFAQDCLRSRRCGLCRRRALLFCWPRPGSECFLFRTVSSMSCFGKRMNLIVIYYLFCAWLKIYFIAKLILTNSVDAWKAKLAMDGPCSGLADPPLNCLEKSWQFRKAGSWILAPVDEKF